DQVRVGRHTPVAAQAVRARVQSNERAEPVRVAGVLFAARLGLETQPGRHLRDVESPRNLSTGVTVWVGAGTTGCESQPTSRRFVRSAAGTAMAATYAAISSPPVPAATVPSMTGTPAWMSAFEAAAGR